jgi:hypothetical protein
MNNAGTQPDMSASDLITKQIAELSDWRGVLFARLRKLVLAAAPSLAEDWKWGTAVWTLKGNVVAIGAFKDHLKLNFFKGAFLDDSHSLFNSGMDAKSTRAIDLHADSELDEAALSDLIRAAVSYNLLGSKKK